jgi:hypothetical protein
LDGIALASPIKMGYKSYNKGDKMLHKKDEIRKHFEDWIRDQDSDWIEANLDDLHHHCFNTDYYIIGTWKATQWLGDQVFNVIETIRDYEMNNFGEVNTDFSDPEKVVNMYTYIIGEEIVEEYKDKISKAVA